MNSELLTQLAKAVEATPVANIDLSCWQQPCGTIHCALGLAASLGIGGLQSRSGQISGRAVPIIDTDRGVEWGLQAAATVFDITSAEARSLFGRSLLEYGTDRQIWLSRYRALLDNHGGSEN